jgi:hypothetical protein
MTAIVTRERSRATWLTGLAGLLILAASFVMMACAAPSLAHARPHAAVTQATTSTTAYTSSLITESWSASRTVRAGHVRP